MTRARPPPPARSNKTPQAAPGQSQDRSPQGPTGYFNNPACDRPSTARAHSGQETERNGPRRPRASRGHISLYRHTFSCLPIFTCLHICRDYYSSLRYMLRQFPANTTELKCDLKTNKQNKKIEIIYEQEHMYKTKKKRT